ICQHPNPTMRYWGAEAVTSLVKSSLGYAYDPPLNENVKLQSMLLSPLQELSSIPHPDIRQKQLECVLQILHNNGDSLGPGWPCVLGVIGAVSNDQGENLIRTAFQSLQLVITDFLPIMPSSCLQVVVDVAGRFGLQNQELNISLTSVGLLWNISDFFFQNREKIKYDLKVEPPAVASSHAVEPFDALWMCLFSKLGELCVDHRPAVRKSSSQTLFSTIGAHGDLLQQTTWQAVLWQVLFPLLDKVQKFSKTASSVKQSNDATGNILIHHSRDTAEKQWAETRVMALAGVARVVSGKRRVLQHALSDFPRAWALLLEFIESAALCHNAEVALAALKSLQEVLQNGEDSKSAGDAIKNGTDSKGGQLSSSETKVKTDPGLDIALWSNAWRVWLSIGTTSTQPPSSSSNATNPYLPAQPFLTALVQIFPGLFEHIRSRFGCADLQKLTAVLKSALSVPVAGEAFSFILPTNMDMNMTPLQEGVLQAVNVLVKEIRQGSESLHTMYPDLYEQLLTFVEYAVVPPRFGKVETKSAAQVRGMQSEMVTMNFVPFGEQVLNIVVDIYRATAKHRTVISHHVLHKIIKTLRVPLSAKYGCPSPTTWVLAINSLISVLIVGLPVARKHDVAYEGVWSELAHTLEEFLFSKHPTPSTASVEDYQRDEAIDCRVVQVIRDEILPYGAGMPKEFVIKIMHILNQGSIHAATTDAFIDTDSSRKLREEFAKACFETLLQFSFITNAYSTGEGTITDLAVSSMLQRCQGVIKKFVEDERLSGKCPLPRPRMAEMCSVLKAVATLLSSLKKAPQANIDPSIWSQVIQLYPHLVDCTTSGSPHVSKALKESLHEFKELLAPPSGVQNGL
ncbi:protein MON2 homolog, partial [Lingula anatina]|uniref:Protein MON2 homolog n=1 Tax=Lingula anatina TaxID=7574 RepID=A0A1S3HVN4_LINAN